MNNSKNHQGKLRSSAHDTARVWAPSARNALWRGGASFLALTIGLTVAGAARAQQAPVEEIVVTGIRKSIQDSLEIKKQSDSIVEVVTAEDIGKLPDESIAESIARLPGLAAQRNNSGRDQFITVRGLPPAMTVNLLNGREQATTSNNRDFQYDQYPSELVNSVLAYKSGDAALLNAGIATIDIRTLRPLDYGKQALVLSAKGQYDTRGRLTEGEGGDPWGQRFNVTFVDQLAHDTLGVMLGYAHNESPNQIISQHSWGFPNSTATLPGNGGGLQDWLVADYLKRDAYTTTLQWKPTDRFEATIDEFYSRYDDHTLYRGIEAPISNPVVSGGSETFTSTPQLENYDYKEKDSIESLGANFKYKITDHWHTALDASYNNALRRLPEIEIYSGLNTNGQQNSSPVTLTAAGAGKILASGNDYSNPSIFALGENLGWANYYPNLSYEPHAGLWGNASGNFNKAGSATFKNFTTKDIIQEIRWDLTRDLSDGPLANVTAGFDYKERKKSYTWYEAAAYLTSLNPAMQVPSGWLQQPTSLSAFGYGGLISFDPVKAFNSGAYSMYPRQDRAQKDWFVHEKVTTGYLKSDIETEMFGKELGGNVGVQWVHTNQSVLQFAQNGSWATYTFVPVSDTTNYNDILPSLNLTYHVDPEDQLRFAAGRSMARARMDTMAGNFSVNFDTSHAQSTTISPWSQTAGNPKLKPWVSDDVDLTFEHYFGKDGYVSMSGFYKNLESFVYDAVQIADFSRFVSQLPAQYRPVLTVGPSSNYQNGNGGSLYGAELAGNLPFDRFAPFLKGFGLEANGAVNISSIRIPAAAGNTSPNGSIPELSKWTAGATLYYTYGGFEARINDRYRSKFVHEVPSFDGSLQNVMGDAENIVDIQTTYAFEEGPAKGLSLLFSVQNVTDEPQNAYYSNNPLQSNYLKWFGTNILFGVTYKL